MHDTSNDLGKQLQSEVQTAIDTQTAITIKAGGSKEFYGRFVPTGQLLNLDKHQGIISYEPSELVLKARAGTPLTVILKVLAEHNQMLAFEPPAHTSRATLGGTIATNFSGPRRAYAGAVRDSVLGTKIINGQAEILTFGGEVMKNVAGYDVSRLMVGALGTLGVILEASIKVVPVPEAEITLTQNTSLNEALQKLYQWANLPIPISASCYYQECLYTRLSGNENAIKALHQKLGGELLKNGSDFWRSITNQTHPFFHNDKPQWRLSLASNTPDLLLEGDTLYEWGGALRWLKSDISMEEIRANKSLLTGHSTLYQSACKGSDVFQPLPASLLTLHQRIKQAFDPQGIFNKGRMYAEF